MALLRDIPALISLHVIHCSRCSVPTRHISKGAAPCPYCLAPCQIYTAPCPNLKKKCNCCFCVFRADVKMLVKCFQICAHVFVDHPQNCTQTSFRSHAGLWPNFGRSCVISGHSCSKRCSILCRLRTELCPNCGRSCTRLCLIYFACCPFLNLAGTLRWLHRTRQSTWLTECWRVMKLYKWHHGRGQLIKQCLSACVCLPLPFPGISSSSGIEPYII